MSHLDYKLRTFVNNVRLCKYSNTEYESEVLKFLKYFVNFTTMTVCTVSFRLVCDLVTKFFYFFLPSAIVTSHQEVTG